MTPEPRPAPGAPEEARPTSLLALAVAWTLAGLPLTWGVYETVIGALALFRS